MSSSDREANTPCKLGCCLADSASLTLYSEIGKGNFLNFIVLIFFYFILLLLIFFFNDFVSLKTDKSESEEKSQEKSQKDNL